jgi:hypothetical protein
VRKKLHLINYQHQQDVEEVVMTATWRELTPTAAIVIAKQEHVHPTREGIVMMICLDDHWIVIENVIVIVIGKRNVQRAVMKEEIDLAMENGKEKEIGIGTKTLSLPEGGIGEE